MWSWKALLLANVKKPWQLWKKAQSKLTILPLQSFFLKFIFSSQQQSYQKTFLNGVFVVIVFIIR